MTQATTPAVAPIVRPDFEVIHQPGYFQKEVRRGWKIALCLMLLQQGATLAELVRAMKVDEETILNYYFGSRLTSRGYGLYRVGEVYHLILPVGYRSIAYIGG